MNQSKMDDFFADGGTKEELQRLVSDKLPEESPKEKVLRCDKVIAAAKLKGLTLWHDHRGTPYATIPTGHGLKNVPCTFDQLGGFIFSLRHEVGSLSRHAVADAVEQLSLEAQFDSPIFDVARRVWALPDRAFLFLADEGQRIVEVDANGYRLVDADRVPAKFVASPGSLALPMPVAGGSLEGLRELINAKDEDLEMGIGWLVGAFSPSGGYPVLIVTGEAGSGKSTGCEFLMRVIDPKVGTRNMLTRNERDLYSLLDNNFCISFENVSVVTGNISDMLSVASTGGVATTRVLFTTAQVFTIVMKSPIIMNGVTGFIGKPDLQDRCFYMRFNRLENTDKNKAEHVLRARFDELWPGMLGALLDRVSAAYRNIESTRQMKLPWIRLTDFAQWYTASEPEAERGNFVRKMQRRKSEQKLQLLDNDILGSAIQRLLGREGSFTGTAGEILRKLKESEEFGRDNPVPSEFPKNGSQLAKQIDQLRGALREAGITIDRNDKRTNRGYTWTLTGLGGKGKHESQLSQLSREEASELETGTFDGDSVGDSLGGVLGMEPQESDTPSDSAPPRPCEVSQPLRPDPNLFGDESDSCDTCDSNSQESIVLKIGSLKP